MKSELVHRVVCATGMANLIISFLVLQALSGQLFSPQSLAIWPTTDADSPFYSRADAARNSGVRFERA